MFSRPSVCRLSVVIGVRSSCDAADRNSSRAFERALEAGERLLLLRVAAPHRGQLETRLHPHQQLAPRERLDQEVVGARLQAGDRLVLPGGARHQDQRARPASSGRRAAPGTSSMPLSPGICTFAITRSKLHGPGRCRARRRRVRRPSRPSARPAAAPASARASGSSSTTRMRAVATPVRSTRSSTLIRRVGSRNLRRCKRAPHSVRRWCQPLRDGTRRQLALHVRGADERRGEAARRGADAGGALAEVGALSERASVGDGARGLRHQRRRVDLPQSRPGAFVRLPLGRGRTSPGSPTTARSSASRSRSGTARIRSSRSACSASPTTRATTART